MFSRATTTLGIDPLTHILVDINLLAIMTAKELKAISDIGITLGYSGDS